MVIIEVLVIGIVMVLDLIKFDICNCILWVIVVFVVGFRFEVCVLLLNCIWLLILFVLDDMVEVICFNLIIVVIGFWFDNGREVIIGFIWLGRLLLLLLIIVIKWIGVLLFNSFV